MIIIRLYVCTFYDTLDINHIFSLRITLFLYLYVRVYLPTLLNYCNVTFPTHDPFSFFFVCVYMYSIHFHIDVDDIYAYDMLFTKMHMGWLRSVGSIKL